MKYLVGAQIFTGIAFGLSMVLLAFIPSVPIFPPIDGAPIYAIHPLLTSQFLLMSSTFSVWIITLLLSLRHALNRKKTLTQMVKRDRLGFVLAFITAVGSLSGCIFYSENMQREEFGLVDGLRTLPSIPPPDPFLSVNVAALLLYELLWIGSIMSRFLWTARKKLLDTNSKGL